jgi:peptidyl-prolyl cis-trans isomerase A (cyclophilin A)
MRTRIFKIGLVAAFALTACTQEAEKPAAAPPPAAPPPEARAAPTNTAPAAEPIPSAPAESAPANQGARTRPPAENPGSWQKKALEGQELYATLETSEGKVVVQLFSKDAPLTVANFVGLATGEQQWTDPRTGQVMKGKPLYEGIIFHRVIPGFMVQGGDPLGMGSGSPGYNFEDEFQSGRAFDKPGLLAMANRGPTTNGSQFFITTSAPRHLDDRHTIFGQVVKGYEVVEKISKVQRDQRDKPLKDVVLKKVQLSDKQPK